MIPYSEFKTSEHEVLVRNTYCNSHLMKAVRTDSQSAGSSRNMVKRKLSEHSWIDSHVNGRISGRRGVKWEDQLETLSNDDCVAGVASSPDSVRSIDSETTVDEHNGRQSANANTNDVGLSGDEESSYIRIEGTLQRKSGRLKKTCSSNIHHRVRDPFVSNIASSKNREVEQVRCLHHLK